MNRGVFLDRDGVINRTFLKNQRPIPPSSVDELYLMEGVIQAVAELRSLDYELIVITNQPDIARGKINREVVNQIHSAISLKTGIEHFRVCPHDDADQCSCRKPQPGMLYQAAHDFELDLSRSFLVGDRWRDIEAGTRAGCRSFFIDYKYDEKRPEGDFITVGSLLEAVHWIRRMSVEQD